MSRNGERKEPLLLRNLFGKKRTVPQASADAPAAAPQTDPGAAEGQPMVSEVLPTGGQPIAVPEAAPGLSTSESVAEAISKLAGDPGRDALSAASKVLDQNKTELKTLARSAEGDPSKLLTEGKKLLQDPELTASARQALEAVTKPGAQGAKVPASSLADMKQLAEKVAGDPGLVASGKKLLSENPELVAGGKELLKENKALWEPENVQGLMDKLPQVRSQIAQAKVPAVIPAAAAIPSGPLPPWVGAGVPAPRDPVADPIPRPEVPPEQVTRITANFAKFDANTSVVTFEENVELKHQDFNLSCQVLVAELKPGREGLQQDPGLAKAQAAAGAIRRATATGYVIIQKISPDGKIQVAKSRQAVYDAETGDVILSDYPQLQSGKNLISGEEQTTKIYLRKNGEYQVKGRAEYEVVPEGGDPFKNLQR